MSLYVVSYEGERCPDGVAQIDGLHPQNYSGWLDHVSTGGETVPAGDLVYRTDRREKYTIRADGSGAPVVMDFIKGQTIEDDIAFVSRYGFDRDGRVDRDLAIGLGRRDRPPIEFGRVQSIRFGRDTLRALIDGYSMAPGVVVGAFNNIAPYMSSLTPDLAFIAGKSRPVLQLRADSLFSFMVIEAALIMSGDARLMRCGHCGTPFLAGAHDGKRKTALYCSNRCRVAAQRAAVKARAARGSNLAAASD